MGLPDMWTSCEATVTDLSHWLARMRFALSQLLLASLTDSDGVEVETA